MLFIADHTARPQLAAVKDNLTSTRQMEPFIAAFSSRCRTRYARIIDLLRIKSQHSCDCLPRPSFAHKRSAGVAGDFAHPTPKCRAPMRRRLVATRSGTGIPEGCRASLSLLQMWRRFPARILPKMRIWAAIRAILTRGMRA